MKRLIAELKAITIRGNVPDMAVGVVIGDFPNLSPFHRSPPLKSIAY